MVERGTPDGRAHRPALARAGLCHQSLATVRALDDDLRARVLARLPEDLLARVEAAQKTSWLALEDDAAILDALWTEVGAERHRAIWSEAMVRNFTGPVLGPVLKVAVSLFGLSPRGLLRFAPQAFQSVFKDAGRLEIALDEEGRGALEYVNAPSLAAQSPGLVESIAATFDAGIRFGGAVGTTRIERRADEGAPIVFHLSWS